MDSAAYARRQAMIREPERPVCESPQEEANRGSPSFIDQLQEQDGIIQHTPIGERATSQACQEAYATLKAMNHPRLHTCTECGQQFGNDQTRIKDDLSNLYGVCPRCNPAVRK